MPPLNALRMVERLARKVEDQAHKVTTETEKLQALDEACQDLKLKLVEQYQDDDLDYVDISPTAGVAVSTDLTEFYLPEWCYKVRLVEDTSQPGDPVEIPYAHMHSKERYAGRLFSRVPRCWLFARGGNVFQRIQLRGAIAGLASFRVWFVRRYAPLHYGTAQTNASTSKIALAVDGAATTKGRVLGRDGAYNHFAVEITGGTPSGLKDQIRLLSGHVGSTGLCDVHTPWTVAPTNTTQYAMVTPLGQEFHELVILLAAVKLLQDTGSQTQIGLLTQEIGRFFAQYDISAAKRQAQTPKFGKFEDREGW